MHTHVLRHSGLVLLTVAVALFAALVILDRSVRAEAARPVVVAVTEGEPSPYARFAAVLEPRRTAEAYREELAGNRAYAAGRAAYARGHSDEAEARFREALAAHAGNLMIRNQLGLVARQAGRTADAEAEWRAVLAVDSAYTAAALNLGLLYSERGAWAEAEAQYRGAIRFNPFYGRAYYNLGIFLLERGRAAEAAAVLEQAAGLTSGGFRARALNNLGRARVELGDVEAAREAFTDAIALKPNYVGARLNLAASYPDTDEGRSMRQAAIAAVERLRTFKREDAPTTSERRAKEGPNRMEYPNWEESTDSVRSLEHAD